MRSKYNQETIDHVLISLALLPFAVYAFVCAAVLVYRTICYFLGLDLD